MLLVRDQDVEDIRTGVGNHLLQGGNHVFLAADLPCGNPEPLGDRHEVGIGDVLEIGAAVNVTRLGSCRLEQNAEGHALANCPGAGQRRSALIHDLALAEDGRYRMLD